MTELVNLTPHDIDVRDEDYETIFFLCASGQVARVCDESGHESELSARNPASILDETVQIPVVTRLSGDVVGLPEPAEGVVFIVSSLVAERLGGTRKDVLCPGRPLRDTSGQIVGCFGLTWRAGHAGGQQWRGSDVQD